MFHCSTAVNDQSTKASQVLSIGTDALSGYAWKRHDHALHGLVLDRVKSVHSTIFLVSSTQILAENIAAIPNVTPVLQKCVNGALSLSVSVQKMLRIIGDGELIVPLVQRCKRIHSKRKNLVALPQQLPQKVLILLILGNTDAENHHS